MIRVIVLLFWLSMIIGTLLAHNVVANWAVTLAGLYFFSRWWAGRPGAETATASWPPAVGYGAEAGSCARTARRT